MNEKYTIVCLLDSETSNILEPKMHTLAAKYKNDRALRFKPHFTLRSNFKLTKKNLTLLIAELENYFNSQKSQIEIDYSGYELSAWGALFLNVKVKPGIYKIHEDVMNIIEKYRQNWVSPELLENPSFKGKQREYVEKFGYHFAFEFFHPHVTLLGAKVGSKYFDEIKKEIKTWNYDYKSKIESVVIYKEDPGISGAQKVAEFSI